MKHLAVLLGQVLDVFLVQFLFLRAIKQLAVGPSLVLAQQLLVVVPRTVHITHLSPSHLHSPTGSSCLLYLLNVATLMGCMLKSGSRTLFTDNEWVDTVTLPDTVTSAPTPCSASDWKPMYWTNRPYLIDSGPWSDLYYLDHSKNVWLIDWLAYMW